MKEAVVEAQLLRSHSSKVAIVLVNWRGWRDTIECLESVFRLDADNYRVIVCDNASGDDSLDRIESWAQGFLASEPQIHELRGLSTPPVAKPIATVRLSESDLRINQVNSEAPLVLIEAAENRGFAAGCNIGIRYAFADSTCEFIWLLNNDTVVDEGALKSLIKLMEDDRMEMCGSVCLFYHNPNEVQALGGLNYSRWTGRVKVQQKLMWNMINPHAAPEPTDYIVGASWFFRRSVFERIGLLDESYFLYYEEIDFASRLGKHGRWSYSLQSLVYHKAGASAGSARDRMARSAISELYLTRGRVIVCRRYFPWCIPSTIVAILFAVLHRLLRGRFSIAGVMLKGLKEGLTMRLTPPPRL
ncbi:MAG: glycosyltransferase family 2 protein [Terracidiphilus sp.]